MFEIVIIHQNILLVNTIILHTDWLWVQWLLSICNMHFHVEFHSPHTDKVQQNWILNMKGVREILSPSLDAIAAAFQTNYSALILQIPVWWPVQCMYTLQGHLYENQGMGIIFQDQKLIRVYTNFEVFYFYKCLRFLKTW